MPFYLESELVANPRLERFVFASWFSKQVSLRTHLILPPERLVLENRIPKNCSHYTRSLAVSLFFESLTHSSPPLKTAGFSATYSIKGRHGIVLAVPVVLYRYDDGD